MRKVIIILLLLHSLSSVAQEGWTTLQISESVRYDDIFFINRNVGWTANNKGLVYKTTNGGESWRLTASFAKYLRCIEFMNKDIGLCGSLRGSLYRTTDGGESWIDVAPTITPKPAGVCGLARADVNTIYGVGIWSEPAFVIKSTDKGLNWTYTDMSAYASSLIDVYFLDANHGFVSGSKSDEEGSILLYTADGGQTWEEKFRTEEVTDRIWKLQTPDNIHFYGSVENLIGGQTRIIRSIDKGETWETVIVDPEFYNLQSVGFIDPMHGWTGGDNTLFETKDGGDTWEKIELGSTYNRFVKISEGIAYLTGSKIYKFTRDVVTSVPDTDPYDPIHAINISPNPTTGVATITINAGNATMAHVYLYSTTGKNLKKIFDGEIPKGEKILPLDISTVPAQPMIVVLKTNEGMISKKLIKQ